jgi:hypothetical protein
MALKPWLLRYVLRHYPVENVIHLDADTLVVNSLNPVSEMLDSHPIVLIPQITRPAPPPFSGELMGATKVGIFNTGVVGFNHSPEALAILDWWCERTHRYASKDVADATFTDQLWVNVVPALFDNVGILRNNAFNLLPDLYEYVSLEATNGELLVDGIPLSVIHFNTLKVDRNPEADLYPSVCDWSEVLHPIIIKLSHDYIAKLKENKVFDTDYWTYTYSTFNDGIKIPAAARSLWRRADNPRARWGSPHSREYRAWLNQPSDEYTRRWPMITRLAAEVYQQHPTIRKRIPHLNETPQRLRYISWLIDKSRELGIDPFFYEPMAEVRSLHLVLKAIRKRAG